jgi:hypothetical protein
MPAYDGESIIQADKTSLAVSANTNIFTTDLKPISTGMTTFVIYIVPQLAGALSVFRTVSGTATNKAELLNSGTSLAVNTAYAFSVPVGTNDTINLQYSVPTTLTQLVVIETP